MKPNLETIVDSRNGVPTGVKNVVMTVSEELRLLPVNPRRNHDGKREAEKS